MINEGKINAIKRGKPIAILDFILMGAVLIASIFLIIFVVFGQKGAYISVVHDGKESFYSLETNRTIDVGGELTIRIENGYAFVQSSDCPNKTCKNHGGRIKYVGQKIVCLPNKIVIKVTATKAADPGWVTT